MSRKQNNKLSKCNSFQYYVLILILQTKQKAHTYTHSELTSRHRQISFLFNDFLLRLLSRKDQSKGFSFFLLHENNTKIVTDKLLQYTHYRK